MTPEAEEGQGPASSPDSPFPRAQVLGAPVSASDPERMARRIIDRCLARQGGYVCVANVHMVAEARRSQDLMRAMDDAVEVTSDGMPLVWELRRKGFREAQRVYGPTLMADLCALAEASDVPVVFFGSTPSTLDALRARLEERFPRLRVVDWVAPPALPPNPPFDAEVVRRLNESGAALIFVGLGCPKQELWMANHAGDLKALLVGVGAAFDFLAGLKPMAPAWMQRIGLEWMFRLLCEPRRLWRRYLVTNTLFMAAWLKERLGGETRIAKKPLPTPAGGVLIIVENLPVPFDRRVWMEATTLTRHGYAVSVICPMGQGYAAPYEEQDGVHIYRHPLPPERSSARGYLREYSAALWREWRLARLIKRERGFDLIHGCNPPDLIFLVAAWFKLFHGVHFLFDHHDLCPELYESKFGHRGLFHRLLRLVERATFALADTVISTNASYKDIAVSRGGKRPADVFVVRSGPDLSHFRPVSSRPEHKHGRDFLVGYLGVMGEFDGVHHLVNAAHELIVGRGRSDIQFCLIGSGTMHSSLQALAAELGIEAFLEFTGRIPDEEMIERLCTCDVGVAPDPLNPLNDKSTMNKILEYMALELPVVQYDLTEGRRSAGEASRYAEPNNVGALADQVEALLADAEERTRRGRYGRQRMADELEWKHQVPRLLAAYAHALPDS